MIQSDADLAGRVARHSQMIGAEYVELDTGADRVHDPLGLRRPRLEHRWLIVDEADNLPAAEVGALQPTVCSRPRAQSLFFGTAPGPMHDSEAFSTMRKSARDGLNPRLGWAEWCAEWGDDIDDQDVWIRTNPAVATGRVPLQAIIDDRAVLPPDTFRAERLSMWVPQAAGGQVFDPAGWEALTDPESVPVVDLAIGVDASPARDTATVCLAGRRADGRLHVEWYLTGPGVTWLPGWVATHLGPRVRAVVVDERGAPAELDWASARVRPTTIGHRDVARGPVRRCCRRRRTVAPWAGRVVAWCAVGKAAADVGRAGVRLGPQSTRLVGTHRGVAGVVGCDVCSAGATRTAQRR